VRAAELWPALAEGLWSWPAAGRIAVHLGMGCGSSCPWSGNRRLGGPEPRFKRELRPPWCAPGGINGSTPWLVGMSRLSEADGGGDGFGVGAQGCF